MLDVALTRALVPMGVKVVSPRSAEQESDMLPSVTVVIPCYNYGHYVPKCVESVLSQSGVRVDAIVIDDASPDGSGDIVAALAEGESRVTAIRHAENKGHIATFNEGLEQASGDYCVLLSADDLLTPGSLARATALMETYPDVGMTYGFSVDLRDGPLPPARTKATAWVIWDGYDWITRRAKAGRNILRSPEAVVRTSIHRKVGGYRPDLPHAGDFEMWMRIASVSGIGFICGADQAYYRLHATNMHHSSFNIVADLRQRLESFQAVLGPDSMLTGDKNSLDQLARRALAKEALQHAASRAGAQESSQDQIEGCRKLALEAWPDARKLREWRTLDKITAQSADAISRKVTVALHEGSREVEYTLRWRRRWLAGF